METSLIEKLDKSRYNLIKWFAFGWAVWYGTFIGKDLVHNSTVRIACIAIGLIGWIFSIVNLVKVVQLGRRVNADEDLKRALNDELQQHNNHKSFLMGYVVTLLAVIVLLSVSIFFKISALTALQIILYVSVLAVLIASLFHNKN